MPLSTLTILYKEIGYYKWMGCKRIPSNIRFDLTPNEEWNQIQSLVPQPKSGKGKRGRPLKLDRRTLLNAICYEVRSGCARQLLPKDFGPWQTVYGHFRQWSQDWTWIFVHDTLRDWAAQERERPAGGADGLPRSLTASRSRLPIKPENAVTTLREKRSGAANAIWRWTLWGCCWA